jgi:MFS family permease
MSEQTLSGTAALPARSPMPGAVLAMTLCAAALIASEFMPVSLLTPLAADLHMTEGQAGQAISVSGIFAVVTSLFTSAAAGRLDRRTVLLAFTLLMVISGGVVAFAPNYAVLMVGRALLGVSIGGFWSMSTATVMRLVRRDDVPRALAILNGGNALAATVAAPLGSFLGCLYRVAWRLLLRGALGCPDLRLAAGDPSTTPRRAAVRRRGRVQVAGPTPGGAGHAGDPVSVHGTVRAVHLPAALPRGGHTRGRLHPVAHPSGDGRHRVSSAPTWLAGS